MEAKKLTQNSYLISDSYGNKLGLALKMSKTILFTYDLNNYTDMDSMAKSLGEKLVYTELPSSEESAKDLMGFPIKHDSTYNETHNENLIIYTTRPDSDVYYMAGWWVIGTDSVYRATLSPKLKTVNEESIGPFVNKFDCQAEVTRLNKNKLNNKSS
jgi:hypothetical protein